MVSDITAATYAAWKARESASDQRERKGKNPPPPQWLRDKIADEAMYLPKKDKRRV